MFSHLLKMRGGSCAPRWLLSRSYAWTTMAVARVARGHGHPIRLPVAQRRQHALTMGHSGHDSSSPRPSGTARDWYPITFPPRTMTPSLTAASPIQRKRAELCAGQPLLGPPAAPTFAFASSVRLARRAADPRPRSARNGALRTKLWSAALRWIAAISLTVSSSSKSLFSAVWSVSLTVVLSVQTATGIPCSRRCRADGGDPRGRRRSDSWRSGSTRPESVHGSGASAERDRSRRSSRDRSGQRPRGRSPPRCAPAPRPRRRNRQTQAAAPSDLIRVAEQARRVSRSAPARSKPTTPERSCRCWASARA